ncbi:tetratricopeptide repeat protein [Sporobolomyces koalae]|uniref:tetratricopeptide repeat protein n=1 Tax=Sporobolomyces koalae TaxID=500713 RepID=UPI00317803A8
MPPPGSDSQGLYSQAIRAYKAASYDTAVALLSRAIELEPSNPKYYDARASAYDKLGTLQPALLDARQVVKYLPHSSRGYLRAAKLLTQAKKLANAEKILRQGLDQVAANDEKAIADLNHELELLERARAQAQFCPFSNLPIEIFLEIVSLVAAPPHASRYSMNEIPRSRPPRLNPLAAMMRVSRTWRRIIRGSPQLWQTLQLDGVINVKNAEKKTRIYLQRALGQVDDASSLAKRSNLKLAPIVRCSIDGSTTRLGLQRIVLTAAQDLPSPAFTSILDTLRDSGGTSTLRQVVLSFVDGSRTTVSNEREAAIATELLVFLHTHSKDSLESLSICTGGRCYPAFDLTNIYLAFPRLESFHIWGNTTSNFVSNLRAPFLRSTSMSRVQDDGDDESSTTIPIGSSPEPPPVVATNARALGVTGSVIVADSSCRLESFPNLESLELDLIGGSIIWELLSCPNLTKYHAVIYGETNTLELPVPDLSSSWARVEDLRIGGAKYLPARFLNHAITLNLEFRHLVSLDLSFSSLSTRHLALFDSRSAPVLEVLNLASTTTGPRESALVLPNLESLKSLNISHTLWTKDDTIRDLIVKSPNLDKLAVVGNAFVTGRPIMELVLARMPPSSTADTTVINSTRRSEGSERETRSTRSLMTELRLEGCDKLESVAIEWLKKHTNPGVVKFQFIDPADRRRGRWDRAI